MQKCTFHVGQSGAKAVNDADRRLRELLESAPDAILEFDGNGRILLLNRMAEQVFGYSRGELLGQAVEVLVPDRVRGSHVGHRSRYMECPVTRPMGASLKLEAQRKDGSRFPVEISLSPTNSEAGVRVMAIVRDISERKQMEDQLREVQQQYIRELELNNRESEEANRLKSEFLSNLSHELRSPLHTIIGFSELLEEDGAETFTDAQKRFLRHIRTDSMHLLALINDLLDLSKIEAGRLELRRQEIDIGAIVEEVLSSLRSRAESKSVGLTASVREDTVILGDPLRMKQILHNLVGNALKFTQDGGGVRIEVLTGEEMAEVSVSDNGIGIPEDQHHAVFDKFHQLRAATKGKPEGTGLGLAITKRLVEEHGGRIWLKSVPGSGSTFTFTIPLAHAQ